MVSSLSVIMLLCAAYPVYTSAFSVDIHKKPVPGLKSFEPEPISSDHMLDIMDDVE